MDRKVAIVTGSRRGIGKAIVIKLAQKGYDIVINDKEDEKNAHHPGNYVLIGNRYSKVDHLHKNQGHQQNPCCANGEKGIG